MDSSPVRSQKAVPEHTADSAEPKAARKLYTKTWKSLGPKCQVVAVKSLNRVGLCSPTDCSAPVFTVFH